MSNETKWDVFDETLSNLKKMDAQIEGEWGYSQLTMGVGKHGDVESTREIAIAEIRDRYASALPDDLPTIPEVVDEFIRGWGYATLVMIFSQAKHLSAFAQTEREQHGWQWIVDNEDEFARAWIYGVWRVEETGEIVKLEAEK